MCFCSGIRQGRRVTDETLQFATLHALKNSDDRRKLADAMRQFIRMYNPHEAREDTVLFPEFRKTVSGHEYDSLGEDFEKKEHELFGEAGCEGMVDKVAGIEKKLGITTWRSSHRKSQIVKPKAFRISRIAWQ